MSILSSINNMLGIKWDRALSLEQKIDDKKTGASPTYVDVCVVRAMLHSMGLPTELVLQVLEYAQYAPTMEVANLNEPASVASTRDRRRFTVAKTCIAVGILDGRMMQTIDAKRGKARVKEIEFNFSSRDQGWTSQRTEGTFDTSSWLEVSIIRPSDPTASRIHYKDSILNLDLDRPTDLEILLEIDGASFVRCPVSATRGAQEGEVPIAWYLQGNRVAAAEDYRVVWTADGHEGNTGAGNGDGFVRALQEGDILVVWARAKYPGWECTVRDITISFRFKFDD